MECPTTSRLVRTGFGSLASLPAEWKLIRCAACGSDHLASLASTRVWEADSDDSVSVPNSGPSLMSAGIRWRLVESTVDCLAQLSDPLFVLEQHGVVGVGAPPSLLADSTWLAKARRVIAGHGDAVVLQLAEDLLADSNEGATLLATAAREVGELPEQQFRATIREQARTGGRQLGQTRAQLGQLARELRKLVDAGGDNVAELDKQVLLLENVIIPTVEMADDALVAISGAVTLQEFLEARATLRAHESILRRILNAVTEQKVRAALQTALTAINLGVAVSNAL